MKTKQALKFKRGIVMNLFDKELPTHQLNTIDILIRSGRKYVINTKLSNKALDMIDPKAARSREFPGVINEPSHEVQYVNTRFENGLGVTKFTDADSYAYNAAEIISEDLDFPILINIKIDPDIAKELVARNDKPFIISACHIMDASLNLDLRGEAKEPIQNEYNVKKPGDIIVPGVTLKQLQDKALAYDELKKKYDKTVVTGGKMMDAAAKYKKIEVLMQTEYESEDTDPRLLIEKIVDVIHEVDEPETFDRADYRDE